MLPTTLWLDNTSWKRLEDVLKTFSKRLEDVFARGLEDVLKTSWRHLGKTSWRRLEDVLKTSWRRIEDVRPRRIYWSWPRRLEDVLKTSSEDVRLRRRYSSWRRLLKTKTKDVFWRRRRKTSSRRLHQHECLLGSSALSIDTILSAILKMRCLKLGYQIYKIEINYYTPQKVPF